MSSIGRWTSGILMACLLSGGGVRAFGASPPACDKDNGGITLPPGFCALVAADGLGTARHAVVAANGDLFVALQNGGIAALHDSTGSGHFDVKQTFGTGAVTGIGFHDGYLYYALPTSIERYRWTPGQLTPTSEPEVVVSLPIQREHIEKGLTFDESGHLYVNIGSPSNSCQVRDRQPASPGMDPCILLDQHGAVWMFAADKTGQTVADGTRIGSGLRQFPGLAWHDGAVYVAMNNRDQLDTLWPKFFTAEDNATRPAEALYRVTVGANYGWPYCFFDYVNQKFVTNPEYGGDGKTADRCGSYTPPLVSFPAHWAPVDLQFYTGNQFPAHYQGGAFIAFHGSWNRAPFPQAGYNVTFQPFENGKPSGKYEVFADGFKGTDDLKSPSAAAARPDGIAQAPDGSLYITDSQKGKIWRVFYRGQ